MSPKRRTQPAAPVPKPAAPPPPPGVSASELARLETATRRANTAAERLERAIAAAQELTGQVHGITGDLRRECKAAEKIFQTLVQQDIRDIVRTEVQDMHNELVKHTEEVSDRITDKFMKLTDILLEERKIRNIFQEELTIPELILITRLLSEYRRGDYLRKGQKPFDAATIELNPEETS